jgi:hypothetical protein
MKRVGVGENCYTDPALRHKKLLLPIILLMVIVFKIVMLSPSYTCEFWDSLSTGSVVTWGKAPQRLDISCPCCKASIF